MLSYQIECKHLQFESRKKTSIEGNVQYSRSQAERGSCREQVAPVKWDKKMLHLLFNVYDTDD